MKIIKLVNNKGEMLVSGEDYDLLKNVSWYLDRLGYARGQINGKWILAHRFIKGSLEKTHIDHVNGNKLDNQRENLRFAAPFQNVANQKKSKANKSGYKGVFFNKKLKKPWVARIGYNNKSEHLGSYETAEEAAKVYDWAAKRYFGRFAKTNDMLEHI